MTATLRVWRCLSLWQPWASAVAEGLKSIETRHWGTSYRGWLAMHATQRPPDTVVPGLGLSGPVGGDDPHHAMDLLDGTRLRLPLGAVVAVARLVDVVPMGDADDDPIRDGFAYVAANEELGDRWTREAGVVWIGPGQEPWGDYTPGRYAWLLSDVRKLPEPIPARGKQGLWEPDDELAAQLEAAESDAVVCAELQAMGLTEAGTARFLANLRARRSS